MDGIKGLKVTHKKSLIRELDKIHFWRCKNLKMGTALCAVLALREEWNLEKYRELKERLGNIGKYDLRFDCGSKDIPCFILSSYNIGRPDQTEMFVRLTGLFQDKYVMKAVKDRSVYNGVKLSVIFVWFWQMRKLRITLLQKKMILLYMYIYHAEADYVFSEFNKRRNGIKIVAVFDDIFPIDNMIVQLCKKTGLKTATFHHAIINGSYKYIDYRYSVSDYFLAWGNYTRDMAIRYGMDRDKIKVLGPINRIGEKQKHLKNPDEKVFGVLTRGTDEKQYINENIEMIRMANVFAKKYGYKYILRLHPSDVHFRDYAKYIDKSSYIAGNRKDSLVDFLEKVQFSICANTSAYAESLYYRKMCYRYIPKSEEKIDVCKGINFGKVRNLEQLERKFDRDKNKKNIEKIMEGVSDYLFEKHAEENYRNFFMGSV